jgi:site-specific DNA-adenine methylase
MSKWKHAKSFPYFGAKDGLLEYYPAPLYNYIFEPFAGSAVYSCTYGFDRDVWLNDKYPVIYGIWKYLINATKSDIRNLPSLIKKGESLEDYKTLSEVERQLLGFATGVSRCQPVNRISSFGAKKGGTAVVKKYLLALVGNISHWKITNLSYEELPNKRATWFIDPPYQYFGHHYKFKEMDFGFFGDWCRERKGQLMVCEGAQYPEKVPDYLPFVPLRGKKLKRVNNTKSTYQEVWYYRSDRKFGLELV